MSKVGGTTSTTAADYNTALSSASSLSQTDFLSLMVSQLKNQDPMSPMDTKDMVSEMSNLTSVTTMTGMSTSMNNLTLAQGLSGGTMMIGTNVTGTDDKGNSVSGKVQTVTVDKAKVYLNVGDSADSTTAVQIQNATKVSV